MPRTRGDIRRDWPLLTAYQRFETGVGLVLTLVIAAVVLVAFYRLVVGVFDTLVLGLSTRWTTASFRRSSAAAR